MLFLLDALLGGRSICHWWEGLLQASLLLLFENGLFCYFPGIEGASEELFSHYLASLGHSELDWTFPPATADFCRADACILMFEAFS